MTDRTVQDRVRDIELVADAVTNAIKSALPLIVRREVELQLNSRACLRDEIGKWPPQRNSAKDL